MANIRILHLIKSLGRGGAEMLLPETLSLHNQSRFEFHYLYFLPWKNQMVGKIEENGGKVSNIPASNNLALIKQYKRVTAYCIKNKIDLIHCHLPWSGFLGRLIHNGTDIPVVYTEHNIQERYHFITKGLNKLTFNYQNIALGVSQDVTESIRRNIKPDIAVRTLLNGVNTDKFRRSDKKAKKIREQYDIPPNAIVVGNIAVFREQKRILEWVKSFRKITEEQENIYGILVGAGPQEEEIKKLVKEYNLEEKLKLPGLQTDTISYFSAMDIFIMSSAFEGLPIALLEAMSMECAIVSTKAGGVVEAVRNKDEGLLVETGDWEALAEKTLFLTRNQEERISLQRNARKRVEEAFSLRKMVDELEEIYISQINITQDQKKSNNQLLEWK